MIQYWKNQKPSLLSWYYFGSFGIILVDFDYGNYLLVMVSFLFASVSHQARLICHGDFGTIAWKNSSDALMNTYVWSGSCNTVTSRNAHYFDLQHPACCNLWIQGGQTHALLRIVALNIVLHCIVAPNIVLTCCVEIYFAIIWLELKNKLGWITMDKSLYGGLNSW